MHSLFEVDVTRARELLQSSMSGGHNKVSFTAYVVACLAKAIESNPMVQAYRDWRGWFVVFHVVDVVTLIEAEAGAVAVPHIVRAASRKTVWEISDEVRVIRARPEQSEQTGG